MEAICEEFLELVGIDTVSGKERAIADVVSNKLRDLGFSVHEDTAGISFGGDTGNLIAVLEGTGPGSIMLTGHLDRVANGCGIKVQESAGRFHSDGTTILAADDVSGICAILDGIRRALATNKPHPRIEVVFTVGEEIALYGGSFLDVSTLKSKICYVVDSKGSLGTIVSSAIGAALLRVEVTGKAAHAGYEPEKGINAAHILCNILATLRDGRVDAETTANLPVVATNATTSNVVCDKAWATGEVRSKNQDNLNKYISYFQNHCQSVAAGTGAAVTTEIKPLFGAFSIAEDAEIIVRAKKAFSALGIPAKVEASGGGLDANHYNAKGIVSVGLATGYFKNHTKEEYLELDSFVRSGEVIAKLIEG